MPCIGVISEADPHNVFYDAVGRLADRPEMQVNKPSEFIGDGSVVDGIWAMLNFVDIVVANISGRSANIFYEVGLAHGLGKPVVIVAGADDILPADLTGARFLTIARQDTAESLAFRLAKSIEDAVEHKGDFLGPRAARRLIGSTKGVAAGEQTNQEFRALFAAPNHLRGRLFENWFESLARQVPDWEIIEKLGQVDRDVDFVIWNSSDDTELMALGNPIPVEITTAIPNQEKNHRLLEWVKRGQLKSIVFVTTARLSPFARRRLDATYRKSGILIIALDRDDLDSIRDPIGIVPVIKAKVRSQLYGERL